MDIKRSVYCTDGDHDYTTMDEIEVFRVQDGFTYLFSLCNEQVAVFDEKNTFLGAIDLPPELEHATIREFEQWARDNHMFQPEDQIVEAYTNEQYLLEFNTF